MLVTDNYKNNARFNHYTTKSIYIKKKTESLEINQQRYLRRNRKDPLYQNRVPDSRAKKHFEIRGLGILMMKHQQAYR